MSFEGQRATGNGFWPQHAPPNAYRIQDSDPPQSLMSSRESAQYQTTDGTSNCQSWNGNAHLQNGMQALYAPKQAQAKSAIQAQYLQSQYLNSAQLMQQPLAYASTPQPKRVAFEPITTVADAGIEVDQLKLMMALAEEYLAAAQSLAPSVAMSMDGGHLEEYQKLIATALACLDATLRKLRLPPRLEANVRLRYASVLYEETSNFMEAETTLSKGISLCEMYHYYDLKYAMQFLLAQLMFENNPKAALKALDGHISDAQAYQHYPWVYALRFLRASYSLESKSVADNSTAVQNLRSLANLAKQQGDRAIYHVASLTEAMIHLKSDSSDALENVDRCMAAAWTYQLDADNRIPQIQGLAHVVDVACSMRRGETAAMFAKLKQMQSVLDEILKAQTWSTREDLLAIPINSTGRGGSDTVSYDTRMVLGVGEDGRDTLLMSFLSQRDVFALSYLLAGITLLRRASTGGSLLDNKSLKNFEEALLQLQDDTTKPWLSGGCLARYTAKRKWRGHMQCIIQANIALHQAQVTSWGDVRKCIDEMNKVVKESEISKEWALESLVLYLTGVYHQGMGHLDEALRIFGSEMFDLSRTRSLHSSTGEQVEHDLAVLATLNSLWILQDSERKDTNYNTSLLSSLAPYCTHHSNQDIRSAFSLVQASVETNEPMQIHATKNFLHAALNGAKRTGNAQFICITLTIMCSRFYANNVGVQAEKSALAASLQAKKSGNKLWMSVTDGLLARCYDGQGKTVEAQKVFQDSLKHAREGMPGV